MIFSTTVTPSPASGYEVSHEAYGLLEIVERHGEHEYARGQAYGNSQLGMRFFNYQSEHAGDETHGGYFSHAHQ